jgi:ADP-ribosyl-[dinitrogen reductase] hydrolase
MITKAERIRGGLYGLLIGDALGVPYEFHSATQIPPLSEIEINPPVGFNRTYPHIPVGTWSDDGAQALCLLDSLLTCGKLDPNHFANQIQQWLRKGKWAIDEVVFDCGIQTGEAILAYENGTPPLEAGFVRPNGKGNGSLMRVLPLALWHQGSDEELVHDAHIQSMVTHGHETNQVCCALYTLWARRLLEGSHPQDAYQDALRTLRQIYPEDSIYRTELEFTLCPDKEPITNGSGYVIDTFHCARIVIQEDSYEKVVKKAISFGQDTDTNAAVAGGLAGIRDGLAGIPEKWMNQLRGKEMVEPLLTQLLGVR